MSESDGSSQQEDGHHRRSRSRSPVSPGSAGDTHAEQEERRLAEAAVPLGLLAGQPQAAPGDPKQPAPGPVLAGEAAPAAQAVACRAARRWSPGHTAGPAACGGNRRSSRPNRSPWYATGTTDQPCAGRGRLAGPAARGRRGRNGGQGGRQLPRPHTSQPHHDSAPKPYPLKAAFPAGRPRPVRAPTPKLMPMDITLPQLQRRVVQAGHEGAGGCGGHKAGRRGDGDRTRRGAKRGGTGQGTEDNRGKMVGGGGGGQAPETGRGAGISGVWGGRHRGRARAQAATMGGRSTGRAKAQVAAGEDRCTGKARARAAAGEVQGTVRGTGRAAGGRGRAGARGQGQGAGPGARREEATGANTDSKGRARGREGMGRAKGSTCKGVGAGRPRSRTSRWCGASPPASS